MALQGLQALSPHTVDSASMLQDFGTKIKDGFTWFGHKVCDLGTAIKNGFTNHVLPLIQCAWDKTLEGLTAVANFVKTPLGMAAAGFGAAVGLLLAATADESQSKVGRFALGAIGGFALAGAAVMAYGALA